MDREDFIDGILYYIEEIGGMDLNLAKKSLATMNDEEVVDQWNKWRGVRKKSEDLKIFEKILKETEELGVEEVKRKYNLV